MAEDQERAKLAEAHGSRPFERRGNVHHERIFLERLIDTAQAIILVLDPMGCIDYFNPYMEEISGYALEEVRGKSWFATFLPTSDHEQIQALFRSAVTNVEVRGNINPIMARSGELRSIEWYGKTLTDVDGSVIGVLSVGHDVSERLAAEDDLRKREARLQSLVAATHETVIFFDVETVVTSLNPAAELVFGYKASDVIGRPMSYLLPEFHLGLLDVEGTGSATAAASYVVGGVRTLRARNALGGEFPFGFSISKLKTDRVEFALVGRDTSENIALQNKLIERERLAAIGTTSATFAHEVGNPLNSMSINVQLLERRLGKLDIPEGAKAALKACKSEIDRLGGLLTEFRSLSRRQRFEFERVDLAAFVADVVATQAASLESHAVRVEQDLPRSLPLVRIDRSKMTQVLTNLLKNAVEAMPEGGTIRLRATCKDAKVELLIEDTGPGIPAGVNVFEPFVTTKDHGTGLGLAVVKQIIAAHRGTIGFESTPARGTSFVVSLPTGSRLALGDVALAPATGCGNILVVDDDTASRLALKELLEDEGYQVRVAANGEEAVGLITEATPDLLLSDLWMPQMNGEELIAHLRAQALDVPTIIMTSQLVVDARREAARLGAVDYVNKPLDFADVLARIAEVLS